MIENGLRVRDSPESTATASEAGIPEVRIHFRSEFPETGDRFRMVRGHVFCLTDVVAKMIEFTLLQMQFPGSLTNGFQF